MADSKDTADAAVKNTADAIQKVEDEAHEKGFYGIAVDETPRENYTVQGVTAGKPTPETPKK